MNIDKEMPKAASDGKCKYVTRFLLKVLPDEEDHPKIFLFVFVVMMLVILPFIFVLYAKINYSKGYKMKRVMEEI